MGRTKAEAPPATSTTVPSDKRITFTLTGAGSFTGFGLARIPKNGTVEVDEETARGLRRTGLFKEG